MRLCRPLLLQTPIPPSIRVFSNESTLHMRWPKYWSFSFSISPYEHVGLISFRMDWLDLLPVQGTLKSLLQHHSSKASILQCSAPRNSKGSSYLFPRKTGGSGEAGSPVRAWPVPLAVAPGTCPPTRGGSGGAGWPAWRLHT